MTRVSRPDDGRIVPVRIRGEEYPSIAAAARHFRLSYFTVWDALNHGRPDSIGLGRGHGRSGAASSVPVTIFGVSYPSMKAASKALGVPYSRLKRAHGRLQSLDAEGRIDVRYRLTCPHCTQDRWAVPSRVARCNGVLACRRCAVIQPRKKR